ncbi:MAG: hypothetical protein JST54_05240 [Deltaproteobacteria bacterium]|nr:hypothetical protein [Deltaproteobacteria bacterium]
MRAGERSNDDGGKKVWHQAGAEVEVISHVDPDGHVTRQECYVEGALVVWERGKPVTTGTVQGGGRGSGIAPAQGLVQDVDPSVVVVEEALSMLKAAPPGDRYLDHFRAELEAAAEGLADDELSSTVTTMGKVRKASPEELDALYGPKPNSKTLLLGALAAGAVVALGVVALLLLRR